VCSVPYSLRRHPALPAETGGDGVEEARTRQTVFL
jgi:hypothetical protein